MPKVPLLRKPATCLLPCLCILFLLSGCLEETKVIDRGNGTEENPYQISTIDELQAIDDPEFLGKHFIQTGDIDASPSAEFQNGSGFKFIGDQESPFTGSYNGNGYVIRDLHLHIQRAGMEAGLILHTGLFGYVKNGRIENVTIDNSAQLSNSDKSAQTVFKAGMEHKSQVFNQLQNYNINDVRGIGFLVGYNDGGSISHCNVTGFTSGHPISHTIGGLVGVNNGLVEFSSFEGLVAGGGAAGLVAYNYGTIHQSFASVRTEGMSAYGLVVVNYGEITDSYVEGDIQSTFRSIGIAGFNYENASIVRTYAIGEARSHGHGAALAGVNYGEILNSYSAMHIILDYLDDTFNLKAGGIVTENAGSGRITSSYYSGFLSLPGVEGEYGGVAAQNEGTIQATYWNTETTGLDDAAGTGNSEGTTGLTTAEMTGPSAETGMSEFDWQTIWRTTDGYPALRWQGE